MKSLLTLFAMSLLGYGSLHAEPLLNVSIVDRDTGATLNPLTRDGKMYVIGVPGHRYALHMSNRSNERIMAVLSVDGVNAVSGETANPEQSGYVLSPYQSTEVNGWRKSLSEIAQFNFTALSDSYAAHTGRANNVGVIGVAVFREKPQAVGYEDKIATRDEASAETSDKRSATSLPSPSDSSAGMLKESTTTPALANAQPARTVKPAESLGTGHGARESSNVTYTHFDRASAQPNEVVSIWYDSYRNLVARGVIAAPHEPQPFPQQFVPDPRF